MSKKKGLSLDEKKTKMLEIFRETKDVFQLKDIEKIAPKSKGIVLQSVKAVLQELVDDGLVQSEKIGTSVYFWSFPGKAINDLKRKCEDLENQNSIATKKLKTLEDSLASTKTAQEDTTKISQIEEKIANMKKDRKMAEEKLEKLRKNDFALVEKKAASVKKIVEAANRWTDNVSSTKTWCKRKFGFEDKELDKNFGIPDDFDYIDDK